MVRFDVQYFGLEEVVDGKKYLSMDELKEKYFRGVLLGDLKVWSIFGMVSFVFFWVGCFYDCD